MARPAAACGAAVRAFVKSPMSACGGASSPALASVRRLITISVQPRAMIAAVSGAEFGTKATIFSPSPASGFWNLISSSASSRAASRSPPAHSSCRNTRFPFRDTTPARVRRTASFTPWSMAPLKV